MPITLVNSKPEEDTMKTAWDQMRTAKEEQYFEKENKKALSRLAEQLATARLETRNGNECHVVVGSQGIPNQLESPEE